VDLVIVLIITLITFPIVLLTDGVPRIILGIILLLIFPGYSLINALFPNRGSMRSIERAGLTLVLSFAIVSLVGLFLNYTPWGIRPTPIVISTGIMICIFSGIALFRRRRLPASERFSVKIKVPVIQWGNINKLDKILSIVLALAVIGAVTALVYVISEPKAEEAFTNFYIIGPEGKIENYPRELTLGEQVNVTLGIENHECNDSSYSVVVMLNGKEIDVIGPLELIDGEKWQNEIALNPVIAGNNQKVEFILYKNREANPYLTIYIWLDVREE
jgi:uncharacterized membrane protein